MENEHQKNDIQKIIQLPAQEEALKHHQVHERSVWIQKALKYNQKNEKEQLQKCILYLLLRIDHHFGIHLTNLAYNIDPVQFI